MYKATLTFLFFTLIKVFLLGQDFSTSLTLQEFRGFKDGVCTFADFDGDGDQDLFLSGSLSNEEEESEYYFNDGNGDLKRSTGVIGGISHGAVEFFDLDGDGDLDYLMTGMSFGFARSWLFENEGNGLFDQISNSFEEVSNSAMATEDIDNDGDVDLILTGVNEDGEYVTKLYRQNFNSIFFPLQVSFDGVANGTVDFVDMNYDGKMDVFITGETESGLLISKIYLKGNGSTNYQEVQETPFVGVTNGTVNFSDFNGDDYLDVLLTGSDDNNTPIAHMYYNDGTGTFSLNDVVNLEGVSHGAVITADFDNDNDVDIILSGQNENGIPIIRHYVNTGEEEFDINLSSEINAVWRGAISVSDVQGDGFLDLLVAGLDETGEETTFIYHNDGEGNLLVPSTLPFIGVYGGDAGFADLDNDGDQDLVYMGGGLNSYETLVYLNDGIGEFDLLQDVDLLKMFSGEIVLRDFNGDNNIDLLIHGFSGTQVYVALYFNQGDADFIELGSGAFQSLRRPVVAAGDLDGDGDQDVIVAGESPVSFEVVTNVYLNDGIGNFDLLEDSPIEGTRSGDLDLVDIDGDSDLDVVITEVNSGPTKIYLNDGLATFNELENAGGLPDIRTSNLDFGDFDNDNDQDVLLQGRINLNNGSSASLKTIYLNDGTGYFEEQLDLPFYGDQPGASMLADIDNDGDLDILLNEYNFDGTDLTLFLNDGLGNFSEYATEVFNHGRSISMAVADIDNDLDLDLFVTGGRSQFGVGPAAQIFFNQTGVSNISNLPYAGHELLVYPNPIGEELFIPTEVTATRAQLFDLRGRLLQEWSEPRNTLYLSPLPPGTYWLRLSTADGMVYYARCLKQ
ncbi:MAG: T9SS type A sorting domain-containing protein [Bacteroidota bacterium]